METFGEFCRRPSEILKRGKVDNQLFAHYFICRRENRRNLLVDRSFLGPSFPVRL